MAAINFILEIYQAIWDLVEAHAPTAGKLKPANEVRFDQGKRQPPKMIMGARQDADFPSVKLEARSLVDQAFTSDPTFAVLNDTFEVADGSWQEPITQTFEAKITHNDFQQDKNWQFEAELMTAIRKGGPRLGLAYVVGWTIQIDRTEKNKEEAGGTLRPFTLIRITVQMLFEGSELIS